MPAQIGPDPPHRGRRRATALGLGGGLSLEATVPFAQIERLAIDARDGSDQRDKRTENDGCAGTDGRDRRAGVDRRDPRARTDGRAGPDGRAGTEGNDRRETVFDVVVVRSQPKAVRAYVGVA